MAEWFSSRLSGLFKVDERFVMHRYQSSRLALVVGAITMAIWFYYEWLVHDSLRLDYFIILVVMAVTKLTAMLYYRFFH